MLYKLRNEDESVGEMLNDPVIDSIWGLEHCSPAIVGTILDCVPSEDILSTKMVEGLDWWLIVDGE